MPSGLASPAEPPVPTAEERRQAYESGLRSYLTTPVARPAPRYRFALVACARWEEEHIVEWLNYHRSIGFQHVYLYGNDDDPATLYERLLPFLAGDDPFVTYVHFPYVGQQLALYRHALQRFSTEAEWLMILDIDEFLCLRGIDDIGRFMADFEATADAVYFNWQDFGTNGFATRPRGSVLLNYTQTEGIVTPFTKTIIRSAAIPYAELHNKTHIAMMHEWAEANPALRLCNVLGEPMTDYYKEWPFKAWNYLREGDTGDRIRARACVAHFSMKSEADFDRRVARGLKGDYAVEALWGDMSPDKRHEHIARTNAATDTYLRDYWRTYLDRARMHDPFGARRWPLLSEGCRATQSSIMPEHQRRRSIEEDAAAVLSQPPRGRPQNHTEREVDPWWMVDLGRPARVCEVRLFNRLDAAPERVANYRIDIAIDESGWTQLLEHTDGTLFGGLDGTPRVMVLDTPVIARFLRITILGDTYLHFDRIEIFGEPETATH